MLFVRRMTRLSACIFALTIFFAVVPARAADLPISAFFGVFEGETTFLTATGAKKRGISVSISPVPEAAPGVEGVEVSWTTLTKRDDGTFKAKTHHAVFVPADPAGTIFVATESSGDADAIDKSDDGEQAAEKPAPTTELRSPKDPRGTAPYLWGRISESTFSVFVVVVAEDGGYEIQIYDRTLTEDGMTLVYSRDRAGEHLKLIEAFLKQTAG